MRFVRRQSTSHAKYFGGNDAGAIWAAAGCCTLRRSQRASERIHARLQRSFRANFALGDREDEDFANRGFVSAYDQQQSRTADNSRLVWDFTAYDFLHGEAPDTVNPSLWRHARLLARAGLFRVS